MGWSTSACDCTPITRSAGIQLPGQGASCTFEAMRPRPISTIAFLRTSRQITPPANAST